MINDNQTKIPEIPRAAAVWKKIRSSADTGVISVDVGAGKVDVEFGLLVELDNKDMDTRKQKEFKQTLVEAFLLALCHLNQGKLL